MSTSNVLVSFDEKFAKKMNKETGNFFTLLGENIKSAAAAVAEAIVVDDVRKRVEEDLIKMYGAVPKRVELTVEDRKVTFDEPLHKLFDTAYAYVKTGHNLYLHGPTGCGKTYLCGQLAKAMGLDFYFTECVTAEHKLEGFTDANGVYHATPFYNAFTKGGLFLLDELDASIPETLVILSMALANKCYSFPAPIGNVYAHPDFHVIAAGNTNGHGATTEYNSRQKIDSAMLNKFSFLEIDYDHDMEKTFAKNDQELIDFVTCMRHAANYNGIRLIISYRNIQNIIDMEKLVGINQAVKGEICKCLSTDDMLMLANSFKGFWPQYHGGKSYLTTWKDADDNIHKEINRFFQAFVTIGEAKKKAEEGSN